MRLLHERCCLARTSLWTISPEAKKRAQQAQEAGRSNVGPLRICCPRCAYCVCLACCIVVAHRSGAPVDGPSPFACCPPLRIQDKSDDLGRAEIPVTAGRGAVFHRRKPPGMPEPAIALSRKQVRLSGRARATGGHLVWRWYPCAVRTMSTGLLRVQSS